MIARSLAAVLAVALTSPLVTNTAEASTMTSRVAPAFENGIYTGISNARPHDFLSPSQRGWAADVARVRDGRDIGRVPSGATIHISVLMRLQHEAELAQLTLLQGQRGSAYYHRYLTPKQFTSFFAPSPLTYAKTMQRLRAAGFRISQTFANRAMIRATAPAYAAERYFRTKFDVVAQPHRKLAYANVLPAIMPSELSNDVVSVAGLHSTVTVHFPMQKLNFSREALQQKKRLAAQLLAQHRVAFSPVTRTAALATPSPDPKPISTTLPKAGTDTTETIESPFADFATSGGPGYGPPIFATSYDFPVQHGYDGTGHAAGSVIDSDYNSSDLAAELTQYGIKRHANSEHRVCADSNPAACALCPNSATVASTMCDTEGESTLDAEAIATLAPGADFYEYLSPTFDDDGIEAAYERAVNDDLVDALNSSFGGCETDDPGFQYSANYIGEEGAAEGITFSASAGDTGAESCGTYASNGVPQTEVNVSSPAAAYYFTDVGGTSFDTLATCSAGIATGDCYTSEQSWLDGGGGVSVLEPMPQWQAATVAGASALAMVSTTGRNTPDVAFTADGGAEFIGGTQGNGLIICTSAGETPPCIFEGSGGTSLSSPMFVALQTTINEVQGSRNGWVDPRLYAINVAYPAYAFRDITVGTNAGYSAATGYDLTTGNGSPLGFELAGAE